MPNSVQLNAIYVFELHNSWLYIKSMGDLRFKFDARKTTQAAAYLLKLSPTRKTSKGHLVKMLYGADKRQIRKGGIPLTGDEPYSMPNGPVLSTVLRLLNGERPYQYWNHHISKAARDTHLVSLLDEENIGEDLLSESEKESLRRAWSKLGHLSWPEVQTLFHEKKNFPEWEDPGKSCKRIDFESIYGAVEKTPAVASEMVAHQKEEKLLTSIFGSAQDC
jgi:hypothetical protein